MRFVSFKSSLLALLLPTLLFARQVDSFYGPIEVEEPVLLELIDSPIFQRLKQIHQYGVSYYTTHREEYNRYDHSIGVFAILRANNASLEEQIAGLLHDASHTAFSHVGDWVFGKENQDKGYQDGIHIHFLEESGFAAILKKYHLTIEQILPDEELFPALESSLPNLCADRIDYNIQGAYHQGFITYEEAMAIFQDLTFVNKVWVSTQPELMKKIARFSIFMTKDCWGSPTNYVVSRWLADAILRAIELEDLSYNDFHYGTDQEIWDKLMLQKDRIIQKKMEMLLNSSAYFSIVETFEEADYTVKSKFRGIDPWVVTEANYSRLSEMDDQFAAEYAEIGQIMRNGWFLKVIDIDIEKKEG